MSGTFAISQIYKGTTVEQREQPGQTKARIRSKGQGRFLQGDRTQKEKDRNRKY